MKKVISCEYVEQEVKSIKKLLDANELNAARIVIHRVLDACKHDRETLRGRDKGNVIKWKETLKTNRGG